MARKSTGGVVEKATSRGTSFGIRFRVAGRRMYQHVGYEADGCTREQAEAELRYTLEQVRRGEWRPPAEPEAPREVSTFHVAASEWFEAKRVEGGHSGKGLSPAGEANLRWQLSTHLLPDFAKRRLNAITAEDVDRWRRAKVREGRLNATSINTCLRTLAAIMEQAVEYGHIDRNPAKGRRRRLPTSRPRRSFLNRAEHIAALLDAAGELDRAGRVPAYRRALLATLTLAGLRIDECLRLRWRHVDLARGTLKVPGTKTTAADRTVDLLPLLRDELAARAAVCRDRRPDALVFGTSTGAKMSPTNVRRRVLAKAVERANEALTARGAEPLPEGLTPHSLRRTFATILVHRGENPRYVMGQMGHEDPGFTLRVYTGEGDRRDGEPERLKALVDGLPLPAVEDRVPELADTTDAHVILARLDGVPETTERAR
jgi:integrase